MKIGSIFYNQLIGCLKEKDAEKLTRVSQWNSSVCGVGDDSGSLCPSPPCHQFSSLELAAGNSFLFAINTCELINTINLHSRYLESVFPTTKNISPHPWNPMDRCCLSLLSDFLDYNKITLSYLGNICGFCRKALFNSADSLGFNLIQMIAWNFHRHTWILTEQCTKQFTGFQQSPSGHCNLSNCSAGTNPSAVKPQ